MTLQAVSIPSKPALAVKASKVVDVHVLADSRKPRAAVSAWPIPGQRLKNLANQGLAQILRSMVRLAANVAEMQECTRAYYGQQRDDV